MEEDSYTLYFFNELSGNSLEGDVLLGPQPGDALSVAHEQEEIEIPTAVMEGHSPPDEATDLPCSDLDLSTDAPSRKKGKSKGRKRKFSKNLLSERRRRQTLNEKLYMLRAIVPKITKMDKASIMADAIDYVQELKAQVTEMKKEIEHIQSTAPETTTTSFPESTVEDFADLGMHHSNKRRKAGLQIEVEKLDEKETCMFRFRCPGQVVFTEVAKALDRLDIEVLSASINVFQGQIYSCYMTKVRNELLMEDNLEGVIWNAIKL